jgi:hypothetical protein
MFGPRRARAQSPARGWSMLQMCTLAVYIRRNCHLCTHSCLIWQTKANVYFFLKLLAKHCQTLKTLLNFWPNIAERLKTLLNIYTINTCHQFTKTF